MDLRTLLRPASQLLAPLRHLSSSSSSSRISSSSSVLPTLISTRGHKTTARTKRSLKMAPHDSFLPSRSAAFPAADQIIYNPPASEASPEHTPFIFLPRSDPRRLAILRLRNNNNNNNNSSSDPFTASQSASPSTEAAADGDLPPEMRYKRRQPKYNLTKEHIDEMRRLRAEDPLTWSVQRLARKFECSTVFVQMAAPAPAEHLKWLRAKMERKMERWGPIRSAAREDRKRRAEMLYRGEL
ncbi:mitochondrial ribosomal protein subunit L20 domain-containing protein [Trichoderma gracile]